jgi:undecaprenyl-diphosphatase
MTIFQSIILGIIQGITEFLPVSSTGHLVVAPFLFGWQIPEREAFVFDILIQVGTTLAVIAYFWKDLREIIKVFVSDLWAKQPFASPHSRLGWYILLSTLPAGIIGFAFKDTFETVFLNPVSTAFFLLVTATLLLVAERLGGRLRTMEHLDWKDALVIGFFQVLALFPGVSRSGSTITGGMIRNLDRPTAARFSFLMMVPIMLAAGGLALLDLFDIPNLLEFLPPLIVGFVTATVAGYIAIHWLLRFLARRPLYVFAAYCTGLSLLILILANIQ